MSNSATSQARWSKPAVAAIAAVLLVTHFATACWSYLRQPADHFECPFMWGIDKPGLTYHSPLADWEQASIGSDSASYLHVAKNFADGLGINRIDRTVEPAKVEPFHFWGPGAPVILGIWFKLTGGETGLSLFSFAVFSQLIFGWLTVATVALYTRRTTSLLLTAFCTGFCPPLFTYFFSIYFCSSEIASLIPLSVMYYLLAKGFLAYRDAGATGRQIGRWFFWAGIALGIASLCRDSLAAFSTFLVLYFGVSWLRQRTKLQFRRAAIAAGCLFGATMLMRVPVEAWNQVRINRWYVSSSTKSAIWRYGLWTKHDLEGWMLSAGAGMGEYLDPEAAARVAKNFETREVMPELYSAFEFAKAVAQHPLAALQFKAERLPVLWLGMDRWPSVSWRLVSIWSTTFFGLLFAYLGYSWWRREKVPEIVYLFALFLCCAMPLIHFEYRYSFPAWHGLVMVPGLFWERVRSAQPSARRVAYVVDPRTIAAG